MIKVTYNPSSGYIVEDGKVMETVADWIHLENVDVHVASITLVVALAVAIKTGIIRDGNVELYGISKTTKKPVRIPLPHEIDYDGFDGDDIDIPVVDLLEKNGLL